MRPDYNGVKYYSPNDWGISVELEEAENIIKSFDPEKTITYINAILELFNVQKLLECGTRLRKWSDEEYNSYKQKAQMITAVLGRFFSHIDNTSFIDHYNNVCIGYLDDFWQLFEHFNCYKRVTPEKFEELLRQENVHLYKILYHKDIVKAYDKQLADSLRSSNQTYQILVSQFLEKNTGKYYLPPSFNPNEYEAIFQSYINSDEANPNILHLIYNAQSTAECPISPKLKLNAKRKYDEFWNNPGKNVMKTSYGIGITFADQNEDVKIEKEETDILFSYDKKWLEENLDYPTILNNFIYLFEMFDPCFRSTLVSVKSKISAIERAFIIDGKKYYPIGNHFNSMAMISSAQMDIYYHFLRIRKDRTGNLEESQVQRPRQIQCR